MFETILNYLYYLCKNCKKLELKMQIKNLFFISIVIIILASCTSTGVKKNDTGLDELDKGTKKFLTTKPKNKTQVFNVYISSEEYTVSQNYYKSYIERKEDTGGDEYFISEIASLDKINEARHATLAVWLYPDSGKIMQVRYLSPTYLEEVDAILIEDVQRWMFKFPKRTIEPLKFIVKYRVVLRKKMSDEQILEEIQQKMKDKTGQ